MVLLLYPSKVLLLPYAQTTGAVSDDPDSRSGRTEGRACYGRNVLRRAIHPLHTGQHFTNYKIED